VPPQGFNPPKYATRCDSVVDVETPGSEHGHGRRRRAGTYFR
jgi:hypothetical protein